MKIKLFTLFLFVSAIIRGQIIADHTVVDLYDDIPQRWIDSVKTMWLSYAGESHSYAIRYGLAALESEDATYQVNVTSSGTPEAYTTSHLRASRGTWGDYGNASGWIYDYGEEDWYTTPTAISRTKAGITYCNSNDLTIDAFGFGWCYDPAITSATDYLSATDDYIAYCSDSINTTVFYTTGPIDGDSYTNSGSGGSYGYTQWLRYEAIRDHVDLDEDRILFDYADILSHDSNGTQSTLTYDGNDYEVITTTNLGDADIGHIGEEGALKLAKAMWWMLARIAGWDGSTAKTWYVSPRGDNSNTGQDTSSSDAWETWGKALNSGYIQPGDTVYFMGGVYYKNLNDSILPGYYNSWYYPPRANHGTGYNVKAIGTENNYVHFWAYPGQTPILDCDGVYDASSTENYGIRVSSSTNQLRWCWFKGLTIRNVKQEYFGLNTIAGIEGGGDHLRIENCTFYNIDGPAINLFNGDTIWIEDSDFYNNCDSLGDSGNYPGNDGAGIRAIQTVDSTTITYIKRCRAWQNGDQGFSIGSTGHIFLDSCWSFLNGMMEGEGWGVKTGAYRNYAEITNSLLVYNRAGGTSTNDDGGTADSLIVYNNTIWYNYDWSNDYTPATGGIAIFNPASNELEEHRIFKNNVIYNNQSYAFQGGSDYIHEYNSVDNPPNITVTDNDFIILPTADSAGIMDLLGQARQEDGSLPDIGNYFKLSSESQLIDAGVDLGYGNDIGAFQYEAQDPAVEPTVTTGQIWNMGKTGCTVIGNTTDDGGDSVTQKGVCWSESENPDTGDSKTEDGAGAGVFNSVITGLSENTTYHVRAYATNGVGTSYGEDKQFKTLKSGYVGSGSNIVWHNGKIIYY